MWSAISSSVQSESATDEPSHAAYGTECFIGHIECYLQAGIARGNGVTIQSIQVFTKQFKTRFNRKTQFKQRYHRMHVRKAQQFPF